MNTKHFFSISLLIVLNTLSVSVLAESSVWKISKDDKYFYNINEQSLIGKNTKKKYQLGDPLKIEVKKADLIKKHLDFTII